MSDTTHKSASAPRSCLRETLEDAFASYQSELLGMLYQLVGNAEDARDAYQDAFLKCWRNLDRMDEVQNLKAWIFRIALNTGRDLRQTAWRRHRRPLPEDETSLASQHQNHEAEVEHREQVALVRKSLGTLRSEEQEVFLLRQNGQMTYEEIADALGVPTGTVKTRMRLAVTKLRVALATVT